MGLAEYNKKRKFSRTPEPGPQKKRTKTGRLFVIQKHRASHLHYDFRLESQGVLKSWAVPKGPSLDPSVKRLAMQVEDHPVAYADFEGIIPEGEYGGGTVMVWDYGTYEPERGESISSEIQKGEIKFTLNGEKLKGSWALVRTRDRQWLLIKHRDKYATDEDVAEKKPLSILTGRTLAEIAEDEGGNIQRAATGDPLKVPRHKRFKRSSRARPSVWRSNRAVEKERPAAAKKSSGRKKSFAPPAGARKAAMPSKISPMLATLVTAPFKDNDWSFEIKWDGVRALSFLQDGKYRLISRTQREMTGQYPELSHLSTAINAEQVILDGEIVALDEKGIPRFQLLQPRFGLKRKPASSEPLTIVYYLFDLIYYDGYDLTSCKLEDRRALLKQIMRSAPNLRFSDAVTTEGEHFFRLAEAQGLEGIVAKRLDSKYLPKRSREWLKLKTVKRQEVVIGGYTKPRGSRDYFGALVVGIYEGRNRLRYVGHTGGGFNQKLLADIYRKLQPLKTAKSPFAIEPKTNEPVQWVSPELVCEVKFSEWTDELIMRHPIFLGLREDKTPRDCRLELPHETAEELEQAESSSRSRKMKTSDRALPASALLKPKLSGNMLVKVHGETLKLTNLDKLYWPEDGFTKGDLIRYYYQIAETMLPYYKNRPLIIKRYPNGISGHVFHQHNLDKAPDFVDTHIREKESGGERVVYGLANSVETLLYLANLGAVSLHPWAARARSPKQPDWVIFDVDPGTASFEIVCEVALEVKRVLDEIGLEGFPKTSGSKGIHVYVPIKPDYLYDQVVPFANVVAALIANRRPDIVTIERMRAKRKRGRVYLDYLQNGFGKTVAGPYSLRARAGATLSAPLEWKEVKAKKVTPQSFSMRTIFKRLEKKGDLFKPLLSKRQTLTKAVAKLSQLYGEAK